MKKVVKTLAITLVLLFTMGSFAYAEDVPAKCQVPDEMKLLAVQVEIGDALIYKAVELAQFQASLPGADVDWICQQLESTTNRIVSVLDWQAEKLGVTLIHEEITVYVGGQPVVIDPARVPGY